MFITNSSKLILFLKKQQQNMKYIGTNVENFLRRIEAFELFFLIESISITIASYFLGESTLIKSLDNNRKH